MRCHLQWVVPGFVLHLADVADSTVHLFGQDYAPHVECPIGQYLRFRLYLLLRHPISQPMNVNILGVESTHQALQHLKGVIQHHCGNLKAWESLQLQLEVFFEWAFERRVSDLAGEVGIHISNVWCEPQDAAGLVQATLTVLVNRCLGAFHHRTIFQPLHRDIPRVKSRHRTRDSTLTGQLQLCGSDCYVWLSFQLQLKAPLVFIRCENNKTCIKASIRILQLWEQQGSITHSQPLL